VEKWSVFQILKWALNRLKTKKARLKELKLMKKSIVELLKDGINPFQDRIETEIYETESALDFALNLKQQSVAASTYNDYESRLVLFKKYLNRKSLLKGNIRLGIDYTMYSFRHTFTTKVYRELRKRYSPHQAKSELMLITGHSTISVLEKYLRDIDAELPEDYSDML